MGLTKNLGWLSKYITADGSGNIGIGTTNPTTKLTIDNSANANTNHIDMIGYSSSAKGHLGYFGNSTYLSSNYYYSGGQNADTSGLGQSSITLGSSSGASSYIDFSIGDAGSSAPTSRMRISGNGNVGIGAAPTNYGSSYTTLDLYNANTGGYFLARGANVTMQLGVETASAIIGPTTSHPLLFQTSSLERMRVTSGGNILINSTSDNGYKLQVNGSITATSMALAGNYSVDVTTNSGWSSYQNIINPGTLLSGVTYMISVRWNFTYPTNNQPYYCYCSFLWVGCTTNSAGGVDNEFTPICSTHTGSGSTISFRSIAGSQTTSGIQARLNSFATLGGVMTVKAIRLE